MNNDAITDTPLDAAQVTALLSQLCMKLGFCLPPADCERLRRAPPDTISSFTDAVFTAEGLAPDIADRHLYRQARAIVAEAFEYAARNENI
jgi:hypothetical protein